MFEGRGTYLHFCIGFTYLLYFKSSIMPAYYLYFKKTFPWKPSICEVVHSDVQVRIQDSKTRQNFMQEKVERLYWLRRSDKSTCLPNYFINFRFKGADYSTLSTRSAILTWHGSNINWHQWSCTWSLLAPLTTVQDDFVTKLLSNDELCSCNLHHHTYYDLVILYMNHFIPCTFLKLGVLKKSLLTQSILSISINVVRYVLGSFFKK